MLDKRLYTCDELKTIYKTDRLDLIKKKLKKEGYEYKETGRGKNYTVEIQGIPDSTLLKQLCLIDLGYSPQTDFIKLYYFLYNIVNDDVFQTLQFNEMTTILNHQLAKHNKTIKQSTVSSYFDKLTAIDFLCPYEKVYYVFDRFSGKNVYIDKDEYCYMYINYYSTIEKTGDIDKAEEDILMKYGSKPKKRSKYIKNGIYNRLYDTLKDLLDKELEIYEKYR